MYAVIKTGGKQYRVKAGDVVVVEKLAGEPGSAVAFDEVLMLGDDGAVIVGAPTVAGASVSATLIETRKGEKIKVFKKIRRQGYRRTGGHRQQETVLRVTSIVGEGKIDAWDGEVDLTPLAVLNARARGLKIGIDAPVKAGKIASAEAAEIEAPVDVEAVEAPKPAAKAKAAPKAKAEPNEAKAEATPEAVMTPDAPEAAPEPEAKTDGDDA
jgi:large subunit ribosomal protein L21